MIGRGCVDMAQIGRCCVSASFSRCLKAPCTRLYWSGPRRSRRHSCLSTTTTWKPQTMWAVIMLFPRSRSTWMMWTMMVIVEPFHTASSSLLSWYGFLAVFAFWHTCKNYLMHEAITDRQTHTWWPQYHHDLETSDRVGGHHGHWLRSPAVEHPSLAGVLSLSCAQLAADGWPFMWVSHPL